MVDQMTGSRTTDRTDTTDTIDTAHTTDTADATGAAGTDRTPAPLHVLHVSKRMPRATGGDAVVVSHLRAAQERSGQRTSVLTSRVDEIDDAPGLYRSGLRLRQVELDRLGARRVLSLAITAVQAWFLLRRLRPDVVHVHAVDLGAALGPACTLLGIPRVITLHGTSIGNERFSSLKRRAEAALLRVGGYASVLTVDPTTVDAVAATGASDVRAVPNAVPLDAPERVAARRERSDAGGTRLLFVGRLEQVKGVDVALDALAGARQDVSLDVLGDGSQRASLQARAERLGVAQRVRFHGSASAEQVAAAMAEADALVLPSRYEGLALVLLEAWAARLPVITTDAGAVPALCHDGVDSLVVPIEDVTALASAMDAVAADPGAASERADRARATAEADHSYPGLAATVAQVYDRARSTSAGVSALVSNSIAQIGATAIMAASGALFWLIAARVYTAEDVGRATALISASSVISLISLAGFHNAFLRYLAPSSRRSAYLNTGLVTTLGASAALSALYLVLLPRIAPELEVVRENWWSAVGLVLVTCALSVNTTTDAAFMALRGARYNLLLDGIVQSGIRLVVLAPLAAVGYLGIFAASGVGTVIAAALSLVVLVRRFGYRPRAAISGDVLREAASYAAGNHVAYVLQVAPTLVIPILALNSLGAADAGYLYLAFTVANVFFGVAYAITSATFAETSYGEASLRSVLRSSGKVLTIALLPASLVVLVAAGWILSIFGPGYADGATGALRVFAASTLLVAAFDLATVVLRARERTAAHIGVQVVFCSSVIALAWAWQGAGPTGFAAAWLVGTAAGLAVAALAVGLSARTPSRKARS